VEQPVSVVVQHAHAVLGCDGPAPQLEIVPGQPDDVEFAAPSQSNTSWIKAHVRRRLRGRPLRVVLDAPCIAK
jgi:hypothetical protein